MIPFSLAIKCKYTVASTLKNKKGPDPDGVAVKVVKLIAAERPTYCYPFIMHV